jgi:hypothetical protein
MVVQKTTAKKKTLAGQLDQLDQLDRLAQLATFDEADLSRQLREKVADIVDVLGRQTTQARQMLRKLLGGEKIELEPVGAGRSRGYKSAARCASTG